MGIEGGKDRKRRRSEKSQVVGGGGSELKQGVMDARSLITCEHEEEGHKQFLGSEG